jgi:DNA-binding beta-propeller fold protein YncE
MRTTALAFIPFIALTACSDAAEPQKLWELSGFDTPESVLAGPDGATLYVSNVAGDPGKKDGNGFISTMTPDGKLVALKWVQGLDAPKGMALAGGKLYVADIDQVVEIDPKDGKVLARHPAEGAKFLNDVAADAQGNVYISDMATNRIWRLAGGKLEMWLDSAGLKNPNGLVVVGDKLVVGAWGVMTDGFATKVPGHLLTVSLADKSIATLGSGEPVGNLDGLEPMGEGTYLATDWMAGKVLRIDASGKAETLLSLAPGTADIGYVPASRIMFLPMMKDGRVLAYRM